MLILLKKLLYLNFYFNMPGKISPNNKVSKRNISLKRISSIRHLANISFDAESPCTKRAIRNLGYEAEDFEVK